MQPQVPQPRVFTRKLRNGDNIESSMGKGGGFQSSSLLHTAIGSRGLRPQLHSHLSAPPDSPGHAAATSKQKNAGCVPATAFNAAPAANAMAAAVRGARTPIPGEIRASSSSESGDDGQVHGVCGRDSRLRKVVSGSASGQPALAAAVPLSAGLRHCVFPLEPLSMQQVQRQLGDQSKHLGELMRPPGSVPGPKNLQKLQLELQPRPQTKQAEQASLFSANQPAAPPRQKVAKTNPADAQHASKLAAHVQVQQSSRVQAPRQPQQLKVLKQLMLKPPGTGTAGQVSPAGPAKRLTQLASGSALAAIDTTTELHLSTSCEHGTRLVAPEGSSERDKLNAFTEAGIKRRRGSIFEEAAGNAARLDVGAGDDYAGHEDSCKQEWGGRRCSTDDDDSASCEEGSGDTSGDSSTGGSSSSDGGDSDFRISQEKLITGHGGRRDAKPRSNTGTKQARCAEVEHDTDGSSFDGNGGGSSDGEGSAEVEEPMSQVKRRRTNLQVAGRDKFTNNNSARSGKQIIVDNTTAAVDTGKVSTTQALSSKLKAVQPRPQQLSHSNKPGMDEHTVEQPAAANAHDAAGAAEDEAGDMLIGKESAAAKQKCARTARLAHLISMPLMLPHPTALRKGAETAVLLQVPGTLDIAGDCGVIGRGCSKASDAGAAGVDTAVTAPVITMAQRKHHISQPNSASASKRRKGRDNENAGSVDVDSSCNSMKDSDELGEEGETSDDEQSHGHALGAATLQPAREVLLDLKGDMFSLQTMSLPGTAMVINFTNAGEARVERLFQTITVTTLDDTLLQPAGNLDGYDACDDDEGWFGGDGGGSDNAAGVGEETTGKSKGKKVGKATARGTQGGKVKAKKPVKRPPTLKPKGMANRSKHTLKAKAVSNPALAG